MYVSHFEILFCYWTKSSEFMLVFLNSPTKLTHVATPRSLTPFAFETKSIFGNGAVIPPTPLYPWWLSTIKQVTNWWRKNIFWRMPSQVVERYVIITYISGVTFYICLLKEDEFIIVDFTINMCKHILLILKVIPPLLPCTSVTWSVKYAKKLF